MTALLRIDLPTPRKAELAATAFARQGEYGAMTDLSRRFEVSRPTVYAAGEKAATLLHEHFAEQDKEGWRMWIPIDEDQLRRSIVALRAMAPNSLRAIENLLPILYHGLVVSYGKVQEIAADAEKKAAEFNRTTELSEIHAGALDEMYSQGNPVLAGVDLDTGYLFGLSVRETRSADDWTEVLQVGKAQGVSLDVVVKDAAQGIAKAVKKVFPDAEQRDDCFHAHLAMGKVRRQREQRAFAALYKEEEMTQKLKKARTKTERRKCSQKLWRTMRKVDEDIELHDSFERQMRRVKEAMEFIDVETERIRTAEEMETTIKDAATKMRGLADEKCRKVGGYIFNRAAGLAMHMRSLHAEITQIIALHGERNVRLALVIYRLASDLHHARRPWAQTKDKRRFLKAIDELFHGGHENPGAVLATVDAAIRRRHRASSAIEGFNAALRPFLYVHKGVTQGFLELFRAYYNLRTRRWGRRKGTSAHECLTGVRVDDWLSLFGYAPSPALAH